MRLRLALIALLLTAGAATALWLRPLALPEDAIAVPSGQAVTLIEVVGNEPGAEGLTARFRFLAPAIAKVTGTIPVEAAMADMQALCDTYALPRVFGNVPVPAQIVISLSDAPVPFGQAAPDVTQYFEAYRIEGDACIWEVF